MDLLPSANPRLVAAFFELRPSQPLSTSTTPNPKVRPQRSVYRVEKTDYRLRSGSAKTTRASAGL